MPRYSTDHVSKYRLYRRTGQAVVTLGGRDHCLGRHGTPESREAYNRLVADWFRSGRPASTAPVAIKADDAAGLLNVEQIIAAF